LLNNNYTLNNNPPFLRNIYRFNPLFSEKISFKLPVFEEKFSRKAWLAEPLRKNKKFRRDFRIFLIKISIFSSFEKVFK